MNLARFDYRTSLERTQLFTVVDGDGRIRRDYHGWETFEGTTSESRAWQIGAMRREYAWAMPPICSPSNRLTLRFQTRSTKPYASTSRLSLQSQRGSTLLSALTAR